jgi:enamine deaminase RidA (YjgF/YER057c/UK114 family)
VGSHYTELIVDTAVDGPVTVTDVEALMHEVAARGDATVTRVTLFGDIDVDPEVARSKAWITSAWKYPTGTPSGVEIQAIVPHEGAGVRVAVNAPGSTLIVTDEDGVEVRRLVHVVPARTVGTTFEQVEAALYDVEAVLSRSGLAPEHIDRTWYFLADIDTTYPELNKARDAAFDRWGITGYPASTGIGAVLPEGVRVSVVIEATSVGGAPAAVAYGTSLQCAPSDYGPRFARANRIRRNGCDIVNISGISSIDESGESMVADDPHGLVAYALDSFVDLLGSGGLGLGDLVSTYVYCKDPATEAAYDVIAAGSFGGLRNTADVCRPELRFEIEGRAIRRSAA